MEAKVTVESTSFHEKLHDQMPKGTLEQINVKATLTELKWSEIDISCVEKDEVGKKAHADPEPDEKKADKERAGKIVTLDSVTVTCKIEVNLDRDIFPLGDKTGKVYLYTTTGTKGETRYDFSVTKPTEDTPQEFNHEDMEAHVNAHADKVAEILAAYLRGLSYQKTFCGDAVKEIDKWKEQQKKELGIKLATKLSDDALAAAGGDSEEQKVRKAQYDSLHGGKGHGK